MRQRQPNWLFVTLVCGLALLTGCASNPPPADHIGTAPSSTPVVGTLRVIGPDVRLNARPARDGETVYNGNRVSTGQNSSAYVYFSAGGYLHLDENSDPGLEIIWEHTKCIIRVIGQLIGQSYMQTEENCTKEISSPHGSWTSQTTAFNLKVTLQGSELTVLEGGMALVTPRYQRIQAGQQLSVSRGKTVTIRRLSPDELRTVVSWRQRFPAPGAQPQQPAPAWCCLNGNVYPGPRQACLERGGRPYGSPDEAEYYCQRTAPVPTWCCLDGNVYPAPRQACLEKGGRPYKSPDEAEYYCQRPEPATAWCCLDGNVYPAPRQACLERGGNVYASPEEAERVCRSQEPTPQPAVWCCIKGDVFQAPRQTCLERGGNVYASPEEAERVCRPQESTPQPAVWCCIKGDVFQAPRQACLERGGNVYASPEQAKRYCQPILR